ncbi:hypothetical protein ASPVEDRAFT_891815 [Aspergillus versicolor CBS 583.65]|uniref:Uncharacterized protein n=1 Tax=Aspergillus versicolor CBS 583.65 TaxID=1036611 RepID=A0A1L9PSA1_ASPVE|nr:uncharacterized protein ASPVEDRAFT_891815 [Aspergillus versicolor CBS 583.65]OJJ04342.1 hypothetical protein ASPVEDRAFT_891815 [Aspergillus versicolor CBS 583.65]
MTLESLQKLPRHDRWDQFFQDRDNDELVELILSHTAPPVVELLDQIDSPTFEELASLPWDTTNDMGVYLKLISEKSQCAAQLPHWVYIGSVISVTRGLNGRRCTHEHPPKNQTMPFYIALAFDDYVDRTASSMSETSGCIYSKWYRPSQLSPELRRDGML